jgi:hypothetical protein
MELSATIPNFRHLDCEIAFDHMDSVSPEIHQHF